MICYQKILLVPKPPKSAHTSAVRTFKHAVTSSLTPASLTTAEPNIRSTPLQHLSQSLSPKLQARLDTNKTTDHRSKLALKISDGPADSRLEQLKKKHTTFCHLIVAL